MANYKFDDYGNEIMPEPKTVSEINEYIKDLIEEEMLLQDLYVSAEISNFKNHTSGHLYFTLKDTKSEIRAVMFKPNASKLKFLPENGMKVIVHARVGVYKPSGAYQLYVDFMQPDGIGSLYLAYEQLKAKLESEGLFNTEHKKEIPKYPKRIGIITSSTGAAVKDIIKISQRRYPCVQLLLYPSLVQGVDAPSELISGVEYFNIMKNVDVIIIGRGGGSIEDLWAFNDECLARTVYNSEIPVISAVGHETDFTICDFVADKRASTPSAAAEIATPDINEIKSTLNNFKKQSYNNLKGYIENLKEKLKNISDKKVFKNPVNILDKPKMDLITRTNEMENAMKNKSGDLRLRFAHLNAKLVALNPMAVLSRGYCAVFSDSGNVIKSIKEINKDDMLKIKISDGEFDTVVKSIKKEI